MGDSLARAAQARRRQRVPGGSGDSRTPPSAVSLTTPPSFFEQTPTPAATTVSTTTATATSATIGARVSTPATSTLVREEIPGSKQQQRVPLESAHPQQQVQHHRTPSTGRETHGQHKEKSNNNDYNLMDRSMEAGEEVALLLKSLRKSTIASNNGAAITTTPNASHSGTTPTTTRSANVPQHHQSATQSPLVVPPSVRRPTNGSSATTTTASFPITTTITTSVARPQSSHRQPPVSTTTTTSASTTTTIRSQANPTAATAAAAPTAGSRSSSATLDVRPIDRTNTAAPNRHNTNNNTAPHRPSTALSSGAPPSQRMRHSENDTGIGPDKDETVATVARAGPPRAEPQQREPRPANPTTTTAAAALSNHKSSSTHRPRSKERSNGGSVPQQQPTVSVVVDAACFQDQSRIMLQSHAVPSHCCLAATMATTSDEADLPVGANGDADRSNSRNSEFVSAKLRGKFLGHAHEVFCLHVVGGAAALQTSMSLQTTMQQSPQPSILCFGDRITIQWNSTNISLHRVGNSHNKNLSTVYTHLLGVHAKPMDENNPLGASACTGFDVGFYPTDDPTRVVGDKSRQWIVMPHNGNDTNSSNGEDCHTVKVGRAALEEDAVFRAQQGTRIRIPVRSGDPVILRHCQTGGILSCNTNATTAYCGSPDTEVDGLCLLTDAHAQAQVAPAAMDEGEEVINRDGPPSLMTRLHRADRLIPSRFELFSFRQEASPAMPLWMTSSTRQGESTSSLWRNARRFSDGSYLWYPDRYQTTPATTALDKSLFSDYDDDQSNSDRRLTLYHSTLSTSQCDLLRTPQGQELLLLDEVLGACMGFEGCYVKAIVDRTNASAGGLAFCLVDDDDFRFDGISRKLVEEILPLPTYFARVRYYVCQRTPGYEYGNVMQALCKSLGRLLEKYMAEVVSWQQHFRDETLTLSGLRVQIHSTIHSLSILWQACVVVEARKGGSLINALMILKERTYEGDGCADHILAILLCDTCAPFMARLLEWLQLGVLTYDPHEEFMIVQRDVQSWENRYELSSNNILEGFFMTESIVGQVLATGRYWNALRFCENSSFDVNHDNPDLDPKGLQYGTSLAVVSAFVQTKYHQASTTLVRVMKDEFRLLEALRLMKRYFLLEHGDFFVNFLDCAEEELLKDVSQISRNRVQHWMNSCLHILEQHPPCNNVVTPLGLRCRFAADGLTDHLDRLHSASGGIDTHEAWTPMRHTYSGALGNSKGELTGLDSFYLDWVSIPFPTSIVLSQKAQECYQLLFRHLFLAKFVERRLVSIWKDHQMLKELQALRGPMGATFLLSQRMLHFIQNLIYYSMFEVVEPQWIEMEKAISTPEADKEQTVDDILEIHTLFLQRVLEACLLTNRDLVRALTKLLKTCLLFSEQMKRFMKATKIEEERNTVAVDMQKEVRHNLISRGVERSATAKQRYVQLRLQSDREARAKRVQRQSARVEREVSGEPYRRMLSRFEEVFTKNLRDFMVQLNSSNDLLHTHKTNLCIRLDYNGYITNSLGLI